MVGRWSVDRWAWLGSLFIQTLIIAAILIFFEYFGVGRVCAVALMMAVAPSDNNRPPDVGLVDCFIVATIPVVAALERHLSTQRVMQMSRQLVNELC